MMQVQRRVTTTQPQPAVTLSYASIQAKPSCAAAAKDPALAPVTGVTPPAHSKRYEGTHPLTPASDPVGSHYSLDATVVAVDIHS